MLYPVVASRGGFLRRLSRRAGTRLMRAVNSATIPNFEIQALEDRRLLSIALNGTTLTVTGGSGPDTISVNMSSSTNLQVTLDSLVENFTASKIKQINISAVGGNDTINIASNVKIKASVSGGSGNDTFVGGSSDTFSAGAGVNEVSYNNGASFQTKSSKNLGQLPTVAGSSELMTSDFVLGPNSANAIGSGVISPVDTVGYNNLASIESAYAISDPTLGGANAENGAGQVIGIVDPYAGPALTEAVLAGDINVFVQHPNVSDTVDGHSIPGVNYPGEATPVSGWPTFEVFAPSSTPVLTQSQEDDAETETLLDIEWAHAIAPDATIYLFQSPSLTTSDLFGAVMTAAITLSNTAINPTGGGVISMSFGGPEFAGESVYDNDIFGKYTSSSVNATAGDTVGDVQYPAMSPYVTSVGGTTLTDGAALNLKAPGITTKTIMNVPYLFITPETPYTEYVWGGTAAGASGTGGGMSAFEPTPVYQDYPFQLNRYPLEAPLAAKPVLTPNGPTIEGAPAHRVGPDVSMLADPETGVAVYLTIGGFSGWEEIGGTSLSAPLFAGVVTLANQQRTIYARTHSNLGNTLIGVDLNPAIYTIEDQLYTDPLLIPNAMTYPTLSAVQNFGWRNVGPDNSVTYGTLAVVGTLTVAVSQTFTGTQAPGEFYDIGGLFNLDAPNTGPTQGGVSGGGFDESSGWGSPNVNYLVPLGASANTLGHADDDIDTGTDPTDLALGYDYQINLTNISTANLGQPTYTPSNSIDLGLTKTVDNLTPSVNGTVTYTLTLTNPTGTDPNGNPFGDATAITVAEALPAGETLVSAALQLPGDTYANGVWTIPTLAVGGSDSLIIVATVNQFAPITNTANVTDAAQQDYGTHLSASVTILPEEINLSLTKSVNNASPVVGTNITYTVTVTNAAGSSTGTNISVTDQLPSGEELISYKSTSGPGTFVDGVWTIPTLAAGATANLSYTVEVTAAGAQINTATINGAMPFDAGTNLTSSVTVTPVTGVVDLSLTKQVSNLTPNVGANVTYSINLTNATGFNTANDIIVSDPLPAGETFVSDTASAGTTYDPASGDWTIPSLAPGAHAILSYIATVNTFAPITNTATITGLLSTEGEKGTNLSASTTINPQQIDLTITKTVSNDVPVVNSDVTYTVTVADAAAFSNATNVLVSDVLPGGESLVSATPSMGSTFVGGTWDIAALPAGMAATLTYVARVNSENPQTNTATVIRSDQPDIGNNSASVTIYPGGAVDLSVNKIASSSTPTVGSSVIYTVTVTNAAGFDAATNIDVSDVLPDGETFVSGTPSVGTYDSTTGLWTIPTLAAGASATLNYDVTVNSSQPQTNTANITAVDQNDVGTNLSSQVTITPQVPEIDLSVAKTASNIAPDVGDTVTYTVTVNNAPGYITATNIVLNDVLPAGETLVSSTPSVGTFTGGVWLIPTLASGAEAILTYVATVNSFQPITNTATITAADETDIGTTLSASTTINPQQIQLTLAKTVSNDAPFINSDVTYTLTVTDGAAFSNATNIIVTDLLPSGESLVSSAAPAGTTFVAGTWNIPALAAGTTDTLTYVVQVNSEAPQTNTATVIRTDQPDVGNHTTSLTINPQSAVDLSLAKIASTTAPAVNATVIYTVTVSNAANYDTATNINVSDIIPVGETFVSDSPSIGTYNSSTGLWTIPTLAGGASATLTYDVTVNSVQPQTNTASITGVDQADIGTNLSSSVTVVPQGPRIDLSVAKTASNIAPDVGNNINYTVTVSNAPGYVTATNIVLTDVLPAGETLVSSTPSVGTFTGGVWLIPTLASGAQATLTYVATINAFQPITNTATITAADETDIGTTLSASTTINPQQIQLTLAKTVSNDTPFINSDVTYTLTVTDGAAFSNATNIIISDLLPSGESLVSSAAPAGTTFVAGTWNIAALPAGMTDTLTYVVQVNSETPQTNTATVIRTDQPDVGNHTTSLTINPQSAVDLSLAKIASTTAPAVNATVIYTVTVSNAANYDTATNINVSDIIPVGETFVSDSPSIGTYNSSTGLWTIPTLAGGASATLTYDVTVNSVQLQTNTATITGVDQADVGTNLSSSVTVVPQGPQVDLSVAKTASNLAPDVGNNVTYTVTVNNAPGYVTATNIVLTDVLPAGETLVSSAPSVGTFTGGVWLIPTLASGAQATLTYVATINAFQAITNTATITNSDETDIGTKLSASTTINPQEIQLTLAKTVSNDTPFINSDVTYTLTVTDGAGFSNATHVIVTDLLPSGESLVSSAAPAGTTFVAGTWNIGTLASGTTDTLTYVAQINAQTAQTNIATVTRSDQPDVGNHTTSVTVDPQAAVDLTLTKVADNTSPAVGGSVVYSVTVTNLNGYDTATNIIVTDPIPGGETLVSDSPGVGTYNSTTGVWTIPTLAAGTSATLTYDVTINSSQPQTNTASITSVSQADVGTNLSSAVTVVPQSPEVNLSLSKTVSNLAPDVGATVTYTVTVNNAIGSVTATNILVTDVLPNGESLVSSSPSVGTFNGGLWSIPTLAAGAQATLTYTSTINSFAALTNTATVTAVDEQDQGTNLSSSVTVQPQEDNLTIAKTVSNSTPFINSIVIYTVTLTEAAGFSAATNILVTDVLPSGETLITATPSAGRFVGGAWTIPTLAAGATDTLVYTALVSAGTPQTNTATVTQTDQPNVGNITSSVTINPVEAVDLTVSKVAGTTAPQVGGQVFYSVTVTNAAGYETATDINVTDMIPGGETLLSSSPSVGTYSNGVWSIPSLAAGASASLTYLVTVNSSQPQTNTATVTSVDQPDVSRNISSSVTIFPQGTEVDLSIAKGVSNAAPTVGNQVTYTVTVSNATGFSTATNILVTDIIPNGETLISSAPSVGTYSGGIWTIPTLASGASATLTYTVSVNSLTPQTNTADIISVTQPDIGTALVSTVTIDPVANTPMAQVNFQMTTTFDYSTPSSSGTTTPATDNWIGTGTVTFNPTNLTFSATINANDLVPGTRTAGANAAVITLSNFPVVQVSANKYTFAISGTPFTGAAGVLATETPWVYGSITVNKNGSISVSGNFYRIQGLTATGKPIPWGNNGPNGGGGNFVASFST